jgi:hypothetical protein
VTSEALAHLSNNLLYSAMAVYAVAMYCYAAELAFGTPRGRKAEQPDRELVAVGAAAAYDVPVPTVDTDADAARLSKASRLGRVAVSLTVLAFALHASSVLTRGCRRGARRGATCSSSPRPARWR